MQSVDQERALLLSGKEQAERLRIEQARLAELEESQSKRSAEIASLQAELAKHEAALAEHMATEASQQVQVAELQQERRALESDAEDLREQARALLLPRIAAIEAENAAVRAMNAAHRETRTKLAADLGRERKRLADVTDGLSSLKEEVSKLTEAREAAETRPDKIMRQSALVQQALESLHADLAGVDGDITAADRGIEQQSDLARAASTDLDGLAKSREEHIRRLESVRQQVDTVARRLSELREEASRLMTDRVKSDLDLSAAQEVFGRATADAVAAVRAKDAEAKRAARVEGVVATLQSTLPDLRKRVRELQADADAIAASHSAVLASGEAAREALDGSIADILRGERVSGANAERLTRAADHASELESALVAAQMADEAVSRQVSEATTSREAAARAVREAQERAREALSDLKRKDGEVQELHRHHSEAMKRLSEFGELYDSLVTQRSRYLSLFQASSQALVEAREKIHILENEVSILTGESRSKERGLGKEVADRKRVVAARDGLRDARNREMERLRDLQSLIETQIADIGRLSASIQGAETEILELKARFIWVVEERNYHGLQLVDRNDELCILYEKHNLQQSVSASGEQHLRARDEDLRALSVKEADLARELAALKKRLPQLAQHQAEAAKLTRELEQTRKESAELSARLQSAGDRRRWRELGGTDPSLEDLQAVTHRLESQLSVRQEQLLEKGLVLEELASLAASLEKEASGEREEVLGTAQRVTGLQSQLSTVTRKLMAAVSELSMWQAEAIRLRSEADALQNQVRTAKERLDEGQPPTDDAAAEWQRLEYQRLIARRRQLAAASGETDAYGAPVELPPGVVRSTAEPRPNAYLPAEDEWSGPPGAGAPAGGLGIPRPYGGHAPFKPSATAATRIYREAPKPREIVL
jgi:chromosome segregation ATPase